ncbi:hypothetical protein [Streptomyces pseudovenezuelae]|uniref:hypothetical protein n=1 Tax=Streptomyces pseudovenezuelae TaxID=67350 RepID=UPI002E35A765|nr:hypothetical protein [Streptomyces pseudovenezuelae]
MKSLRPVLTFLALALLGSLSWNSPASASDRKPVTLPAQVKYVPALRLPTRPCSEDNTVVRNCYWDAGKRGNGYSYYIDRSGNVVYLNPKLNDQAARLKFNSAQAKAGKELWGTVDGHQFCWAKVGDTSYVYCFDGYKTTT